jgi:transcriptional regulator with XRE-family HTH domain
MSKRSQIKRITLEGRTLGFLRKQAGLSLRKVAALTNLSDSLIHHLEQGRLDIHERHLQKLLPAYRTTLETFRMFASGSVAMPQNLRAECLEIIDKMSIEQLRTAHPVLASLCNLK